MPSTATSRNRAPSVVRKDRWDAAHLTQERAESSSPPPLAPRRQLDEQRASKPSRADRKRIRMLTTMCRAAQAGANGELAPKIERAARVGQFPGGKSAKATSVHVHVARVGKRREQRLEMPRCRPHPIRLFDERAWRAPYHTRAQLWLAQQMQNGKSAAARDDLLQRRSKTRRPANQ